jgi:tetratricopeptide (TPR) repeat protein
VHATAWECISHGNQALKTALTTTQVDTLLVNINRLGLQVTPSNEPTVEAEVPLYDVVVRVLPGNNLEDVENMARDFAAISPERVEGLIRALRNAPQVKIGTNVTRERADGAKEQFSKAGLEVVITPVLALQAKMASTVDTLFKCRACGHRFEMTPNRQCPGCSLFIDKVTDAFLMKRRIMENERAKLQLQADRDAKESADRTQQSLEAALRAQIREELEEEFGLKDKGGVFQGKKGLMRATGMVSLLALAFVGGGAMSASGLPWAKKEGTTSSAGKTTAPAEIDKMLDSIGPKTAGGADAASATGDADIDDMLAQQGGSKGGKGISVDQAVAASTALAKSVGMGVPGAGGAAAASAAAGQPADAAAAPVTNQAKLLFTADFAKHLAELGQAQRARDVIKTLKASPHLAADPVAVAAVRLADLEVQAWAIGLLGESRARGAAEAIKTDAMALTDPAERAQALGRMGVVLSRHAQLPPEAVQAFLTMAADSLKQVSNANQRSVAVGDWMVSLGEVLLADVSARAKAGLWTKARAAAGQLDGLIKQATEGASQARLYAIDYQINQQLGQLDRAKQSLEMAVSMAEKVSNLSERTALLRGIAQLSGAASNERLQASINAVVAQLESKGGMEKAQALVNTALLFADAGMRPKVEQFTKLAQAVIGLSPADTTSVNTDLIVRGDMAAAKVLHGLGQYAESEVLLKRLGGYLL